MDLGAYQLQIFLSLFVVLGAGFVALVCDLLKGNNEQLRELNIELKVRREEEQKRFEILLGEKKETKTQEAPAAVAAAVPAAVEVRAERNSRPSRLERKRAPAQEALAAMERGAQMASTRRGPQTVESVPAEIERPAQVAATGYAPLKQEEQVVEHVMETVVERVAEIPAAAALSARPAPQAPAAMSTRDWSSLLNRRATPAATSQPGQAAASAAPRNDLLEAVVAATDSTAPSQPSASPLPAGFQDGFVLTRLVERRQPISGLVVSIGVAAQEKSSDKDVVTTAAEPVPAMVRSLVESLIGPGDFAAQSAKEEYLLIYPGVRGVAAQRKLSEVAQQLWDFQLRSMGQFSVQFSWGGVEVRSESIEEAIASATERMNETRRGRKVVSMDSERSLPKAV
jgi:hypothetical protein